MKTKLLLNFVFSVFLRLNPQFTGVNISQRLSGRILPCDREVVSSSPACAQPHQIKDVEISSDYFFAEAWHLQNRTSINCNGDRYRCSPNVPPFSKWCNYRLRYR
jgi:hypothetical protein